MCVDATDAKVERGDSCHAERGDSCHVLSSLRVQLPD